MASDSVQKSSPINKPWLHQKLKQIQDLQTFKQLYKELLEQQQQQQQHLTKQQQQELQQLQQPEQQQLQQPEQQQLQQPEQQQLQQPEQQQLQWVEQQQLQQPEQQQLQQPEQQQLQQPEQQQLQQPEQQQLQQPEQQQLQWVEQQQLQWVEQQQSQLLEQQQLQWLEQQQSQWLEQQQLQWLEQQQLQWLKQQQLQWLEQQQLQWLKQQQLQWLEQQAELNIEMYLQQLHNEIAMAYTIAVKKGMGAANQFKLVMLGAEGAGKTSTVKSLIGKDFQPHQPSTIGTDISNTCTVDRYCVTNWKLKELYKYLKDISIQYKHELQETMIEPTDSEPNQESLKDVSMTTVQDIIQNVVHDGKIRIVIYDLGGQEVFYEIHFLFLASCDVVFLTFNASENLDAPVIRRQRFTISQEVYKTRKTQTNYEVIETTLQAIYSHCGMEGNKDSLSPRIPTVIMVGTHTFNLTVKEKTMITEMLIKRLSSKPIFDHFPRKKADAIHFIDNKERDPEAFSHLKAVAIRAAYPAINEERPVSYLKFEEKILEISQEETRIDLKCASDIAASVGLQNNPESLLTLLQYYNSKGILLYYPEVEELKNLIFISPQNVSDLVSCVIKTHNYAEPIPTSAYRKKFDRFDEFGILEESLLDDILKRSGYVKNIVLAFLEKFDLAVEIDKDTKFENENDSYRTPDSGRVFFIPSMLVYNEGENSTKPEGHVDNVVLYYFPDEFLPETVFNHVLISTIKWCQKNSHHICRVCRGIGVFDFKNRKQGFTLQLCSVTFSIKCYIFVLQQEMHNRDLWLQRRDLLQEHLPSFILDAHNRCIFKADQPIAYMECPMQHDENCAPHVRLDTLAIDTDVWCTRMNPKKLVSKDAYNLLLQPQGNTDESNEYDEKSAKVTCAVVLCPISERCKRPTHKELNRRVVNQYATRWNQIGIELGVHIANLANIEYNHRECAACFRETINTWLESNPLASWKMLEVAITNVLRAENGLVPVEDIYGPKEQQIIQSQILHSHSDPYNKRIVHRPSAKPINVNDSSMLQQGLQHQLSSLSLSPVVKTKKPPLSSTAKLESQWPLPTRNMQPQQRIMQRVVQAQPSQIATVSPPGGIPDEEQALHIFTLLESDATPIYSIHSYNEMFSELAINMMGEWEDLGRKLNVDDLAIHSIQTHHYTETSQAEQMLQHWLTSERSKATLGVLTTAVYDLGQRYWNLLNIIAKYGKMIAKTSLEKLQCSL